MKAIQKDTFREIRNSFGRFISIFLMIALGAFVYVGINAAGPIMNHTVESFADEQNMSDIKIMSTFGIDDTDKKIVEDYLKEENVQIEFGKEDVFPIKDRDENIKIMSIPQKIDIPKIMEGQAPKDGEILLDASLKDKGYNIGEEIELKNSKDIRGKEKDVLNTYKYKISGFVISSDFLSEDISQSNIGSGVKFNTFGFISMSNFKEKNEEDNKKNIDLNTSTLDMDATYDLIRIRYKELREYNFEDNKYKKLAYDKKQELQDLLKNRPEVRLDKIKTEISNSITEGEDKIAEVEKKLEDAKKELKDGQIKLEDARKKYTTGINKYNSEIYKAYRELQNGETKYKKGEKELKDGESKLNKAIAELDKSKKEYNNGLKEYNSAIKKINDEEKQVNEILNNENSLRDIQNLAKMNMPLEQVKTMIPAQYIEMYTKEVEAIKKGQSYIENIIKEAKSGKQKIDTAKSKLREEKKELDSAKTKLDSGQQQLDQEIKKINAAKLQIQKSRRELNSGWTKYNNEKVNGKKDLEKAEAEIAKAEKDLEKGKKEFEENEAKAKKEIKEAKEEIKEAKDFLGKLKLPLYYIQSRNDNSGYFLFHDSAQRVKILSGVFPPVFFLIALLVSLTTTTRMADEQRTTMGILKALGYSNFAIMSKYITYAGISGFVGALVGIAAGQRTLSKIIYDAYAESFVLKDLKMKFFWDDALVALLLSLACTTLAAIIATRRHLKQNAATLMRPKPPKKGNKILLERIPWLWNKISYIQKITLRNLFRYIMRMLMTIIGVAGSFGLIFMGFALRDSIYKVPVLQYDQITKYDIVVGYDKDYAEKDLVEYEKLLKDKSKIKNSMNVYIENLKKDDMHLKSQDIVLHVPEDEEKLKDFINFLPKDTDLAKYNKEQEYIVKQEEKKKTKEDEGKEYKEPKKLQRLKQNYAEIQLTDEEILLTDKIAQMIDAKVGEEIKVRDGYNNEYNFKVTGIIENFMGHQIYMTPKYYEEQFNKKYKVNASYIQIADVNEEILKQEELKDKELIKIKEEKIDKLIKAIDSSDTAITANKVKMDALDSWFDALNLVVGVLILLSAMLAFIVLYNLNNVNIGERTREIATIKVLGFYPFEVTSYIYRETIILSIIGILIGYGLGNGLFQLILTFIVPDVIKLYGGVSILSYIYSSVITMSFVLIVGLVIHFKLKKLDMNEALKNYE